MPLYIEPENLRGIYSDEIVDAFCAIKREVEGVSVTPWIALNLIRKYFLPLSPTDLTKVLEIRKGGDWNTVEFVGVSMVGKGAQQGEPNPIGFAILDLYSWLRSPRQKAKSIEPSDVFASCRLCWRHPVTYRNYCYLHHPEHNNTNYERARSLKQKSDAIYDEIAKAELDEYNQTQNAYKMFFPERNQKEWLKSVRPSVWSIVSPIIGDCLDEDFLRLLLQELDSIPGESLVQKAIREKMHSELIANPHLISYMLHQAEAWIRAAVECNGMHGGKRAGAGRKKKISG